MCTDEDKMIVKLGQHRDTIKLVKEIAKLHNIPVTATVNNDPRGDFEYPQSRKNELINALDKYIGKYKHIKDNNNE